MAIHFTARQQRVLEARNHNILVSAAAGSGKTAVLVERIVRLITEPQADGKPVDIDRLLVVTFTRAAAAQMRERIAAAIGKRLLQEPDNEHLQRQETLLQRAQITTIDSFCTFLLRNHFSDIGLDPAFRQADEMETALLRKEVLGAVLEEAYAENAPDFRACVAYFCPGMGDARLEEMIDGLYRRAMSHPWPQAWLRERAGDYAVRSAEELYGTVWMQETLRRLRGRLSEMAAQYEVMIALSGESGGPYPYADFLREEKETLFGAIGEAASAARSPAAQTADTAQEPRGASASCGDAGSGKCSAAQAMALARELRGVFAQAGAMKALPRVDAKRFPDVDAARKTAVQTMRNALKKELKQAQESVFGVPEEETIARMAAAQEPLLTLLRLTERFIEAFLQAKQEKNIIDFDDLEHLALQILCERREDGSVAARRTALAYRTYFHEILIDEYQDSNDVQELLLSVISGEEEGRFNRFMVGDVKQSIYKFRLARPEIFMEKFAAYRPEDARTERIDLDQNFRSRRQVLASVNAVSEAVMRAEVGGVEYDDAVSLKLGAGYPEEERGADGENGTQRPDPYETELLVVDEQEAQTDSPDASAAADVYGRMRGEASGTSAASVQTGGGAAGTSDASVRTDSGAADGWQPDGAKEADEADAEGSFAELTARKREALAIARRIRELVGVLPVSDEESGARRPARFGDIVILLRSGTGWEEDLKEVLEREGIPSYMNTRTGYFAAEEIRQVLQLLRVLDNPRQDIPLYGAMRGYFGRFSQEELAQIRAAAPQATFYDALTACAEMLQPSAEAARGPAACAETLQPSVEAMRGTAACAEPVQPSAETERETDGNAEPAPLSGAAAVSSALRKKCRGFVSFVEKWRARSVYLPVQELLMGLFEETGCERYMAALPGGAGRLANLQMLCAMAASFEKTSYSGLFQFLRYIDQLHRYEADYGEANTLDEKADVVRIMSIHKSKGLEFPICFVAGLSKRFNRQDASGDLIIDNDWGVGLSYVDPLRRVRGGTLRRDAIADKIRRDSLGEELRILYVAMTRAKEKLILSAYVRDYEKKREAAALRAAGAQGPHLPVSAIEGAGSFFDLLLAAEAARQERGGKAPFAVRLVGAQSLSLQEEEEQLTLGARQEALARTAEAARRGVFADGALAADLTGRLSAVYPHERLAGVCTKTSVSELKKAALHGGAWDGAEQTQEDSGESGSAQLFPPEEVVPYIPRFVKTEMAQESAAAGQTGPEMPVAAGQTGQESAAAGAERQASLTGAARGTAIHRFMELFDYAAFPEPEKMDERALADYTQRLLEEGRLAPEEKEALTPQALLPFLRSRLAARMARAAAAGRLFREQPFVLGVPADRLRPEFPPEEQVMIQGIIDAFFIEDGKIIVADYKTDRVPGGAALAARYRVQLNYYAEALTRLLGRETTERIIYSFALGEEILL